MRAPDFSGLAPASIFTAEMDPLRDEGAKYAAQLQAAGVAVQLTQFPGVPHTFASLDGILDSGKTFNQEAIRSLKAALVGAAE